MLIFAKKYKLIRIVQQNDWVVIILVSCIFLYIFMLLSLRRDSSVTEFLLQKFADSTNNFLSWIIISFVFAFAFLFKQIYYILHSSNILPQKWYYKFLYICTLQIVPVLVLWKLLFF